MGRLRYHVETRLGFAIKVYWAGSAWLVGETGNWISFRSYSRLGPVSVATMSMYLYLFVYVLVCTYVHKETRPATGLTAYGTPKRQLFCICSIKQWERSEVKYVDGRLTYVNTCTCICMRMSALCLYAQFAYRLVWAATNSIRNAMHNRKIQGNMLRKNNQTQIARWKGITYKVEYKWGDAELPYPLGS